MVPFMSEKTKKPPRPGNILSNRSGFTLVEIAIVLVIVGLLLNGGMMILSSQQEMSRIEETTTLLNEAREALIGYAIVNGRLPCPASGAANGMESPAGGGACTNPFNGFLPAVTLGLSGVDASGYLRDAWQLGQNRIRYAVTTANANSFTTANGMKTIGMSALASDLRVCASSTGISATECATPETTNVLSNSAVAVLYSLGKNAPSGGSGADETANPNPNSGNNDPVFVSHTPMGPGGPGAGGEFDDLVIWLSPNILFYRMVSAGVLP